MQNAVVQVEETECEIVERTSSFDDWDMEIERDSALGRLDFLLERANSADLFPL